MKHPKIRFLHERVKDFFPKGMPFSEVVNDLIAIYDLEHPGRYMNGPLALLLGFMRAGAFDGSARTPVARYVVTQDLADALAETEPPAHLTEEDLRLPEGAIVIKWPSGEELYAIEFDRVVEWLDRYWPDRPFDFKSTFPALILWEQFDVLGKRGQERWYRQMDAHFGKKVQRHEGEVPFGETWFGSLNVDDPPAYSTPSEMEEVAQREAMFRNLIVYLTTGNRVDAATTNFKEPGKGKGKRKGGRDKERFYNYIHLGTRTKMLTDREVEERARRMGRRLQHRVRVRGHWRHQAHGTGRKLRKWIWIEPFYRGPDGEDFIDRVVRLDL